MNNKGFTVIELILSFAFVSVLTISLLSLVMNYRQKEIYAADITELTRFKNNITMMIEKDIEQKLLKKIDYCTSGGNVVNRCIVLTFNDGTSKELRIAYYKDSKTIRSSTFRFNRYYIIYDGIIYEAPSAGNVEIRSDYMLDYTTKDDALENNLGLYKINIGLYHKSLKINSEISIVAIGKSRSQTTATGPYQAYNTGDLVAVTLNGSQNREFFYVIKDSNTFDGYVTLLYQCAWKGSEYCRANNSAKVAYNASLNFGNKYEGSAIYQVLDDAYSSWTNLNSRSDIRLITANEMTLLNNARNSATLTDVPSPVELDTANTATRNYMYIIKVKSSDPTWKPDYWTMSNYLTSGTEDSVWYVNSSDRTLKKGLVTEKHYVRPVIVLDKLYVSGKVSSRTDVAVLVDH